MYHFILPFISISLPEYQQQEAWIWLVPFVLLGGASYYYLKKKSEKQEEKHGKTIAVLGMKGVGKTLFLANISNKDYKDCAATIGSEDYKGFYLSIGGHIFFIKGGKDIGGGEEYIRDYYEEMIKNSEIVFFLFNAYKYLNEKDYRDQTQARFEFIYRHSQESNTNVIILATFADKFSSVQKRNDAYTSIKNSVSEKSYQKLLIDTRFFLLDMRDKVYLFNKILTKIFKDE